MTRQILLGGQFSARIQTVKHPLRLHVNAKNIGDNLKLQYPQKNKKFSFLKDQNGRQTFVRSIVDLREERKQTTVRYMGSVYRFYRNLMYRSLTFSPDLS